MKLKNTDELRRRAEWHAKHDHVNQGTYGDASMNGAVEFQGCAITCLATPHTTKGLRAHIAQVGIPTWTGGFTATFKAKGGIARLRREFGICPALARSIETLFEALPTHGAAISFIPAVARAMPEGANINARSLNKAWPEITGNEHATVESYRGRIGLDATADAPDMDEAEAASRRFIKWLREQG